MSNNKLDRDLNDAKERDNDRKIGLGLDPNDSLVGNAATSYISINYLYQFMKMNYREDDNIETVEDNQMLKKYRNVLLSKGISGGASEKLYVIASRVLKKVCNDDNMSDVREFHKSYREEALRYSREPDRKVTNDRQIDNKREVDVKRNEIKKRNYPSPFDIRNPNEIRPPSPYNR